MPLLLLLFLTLACLPDEWQTPWGPFAIPGRSVAFTWSGVLLIAVQAWALSFQVRRHLEAFPDNREMIARRYGRARFYHTLTQMAVFALTLYLFGWGWAVQSVLGQGNAQLPAAELLTVAPFFAGLLLSWVAFYDAERALHADPESEEPYWTRRAYVVFHLRQNVALVFIPILLLVLMKSLRRLLPESADDSLVLGTLAGPVLAVVVYVSMPWILRLALGLRPLPEGPLRDRLMATARRLNFRSTNILLWNTNNGVANAMVAGIVPWIRYVFLTDRLISELTPDELEAVFGHEVGHVKHHHMLYYLGFLKVSLLFLGAAWYTLAGYVPYLRGFDSALEYVPLVTMLGAYIFLVFGFLSRRCERQADVYGCRAVSCPGTACEGHPEGQVLAERGTGLCPTGIRTFIAALEKVATLNGISRDRPGLLQSWMHSTIARRVEFLQRILVDPSLERKFQKRVALVKWGLLVGLSAALVTLMVFTAQSRPEPQANVTQAQG